MICSCDECKSFMGVAPPHPPSARLILDCHYCGAIATTRDHIVPLSRMGVFNRPTQQQNQAGLNVVPACKLCNHTKAALRSSCRCPKCRDAWELWGPANWREIPVIHLARNSPTNPEYRSSKDRS